jgi:hypothetical protein
VLPAAGRRSTLALAGLYEVWYDRSLPENDPARVVPRYTITTTATDSLGRIHDRMPMAITPDHWAERFDPRNHDVDQLRGRIAPPADGSLEMHAASKAVNNVKNNGPGRPFLSTTDARAPALQDHDARDSPDRSLPGDLPVPQHRGTDSPFSVSAPAAEAASCSSRPASSDRTCHSVIAPV